MKNNWKKILDNMPWEKIEKALLLFKNKGYVTDEDHTFISKIMIKEGGHQLRKLFEKAGYNEDRIMITAKYYSFLW